MEESSCGRVVEPGAHEDESGVIGSAFGAAEPGVAGGSAASNAVWEGVSVSRLLEQAQVQADAGNVLVVGADRGRLLAGSPVLPYSRVLPIGKCRAMFRQTAGKRAVIA